MNMNNNCKNAFANNSIPVTPIKKQHYVFQAYLRRFSSDIKNKMIWTYIKNNGVKKVPIKDVAFSNKMYEAKLLNDNEVVFFMLSVYILNRDNIEFFNSAKEFIIVYNEPLKLNKCVNAICDSIYKNTNGPNQNVIKKFIDEFKENNKAIFINTNEKYYSSIESELNKFIEDVINLNYEEIKKNRKFIVRDLCYQYFRTKSMRNRIREAFAKLLDEQQICIVNGIKSEDVDIENLLTPYLLFLPMVCNNDYNITILKNKTNVDFITCDQPVINLCADYKSNAAPTELKFYYPISPKYALLVSDENELEFEDVISVDKVNMLNNRIIDAHDEFLFACNEDQLKLRF